MRNFKVPSFAERRAKIKTVADIETQLALAKQYVASIKREMKGAPTLAAKQAIAEKVVDAERVLRRLRMESFDIEDEINAKNS